MNKDRKTKIDMRRKIKIYLETKDRYSADIIIQEYNRSEQDVWFRIERGSIGAENLASARINCRTAKRIITALRKAYKL